LLEQRLELEDENKLVPYFNKVISVLNQEWNTHKKIIHVPENAKIIDLYNQSFVDFMRKFSTYHPEFSKMMSTSRSIEILVEDYYKSNNLTANHYRNDLFYATYDESKY
jgi:hypothetical protein